MPHADSHRPADAAPRFFDARATAQAVGFAELVDAVAVAAGQVQQGRIASPARLSVPLAGEGVMLSMPASASDIAIHKLVNVQPANAAAGLATLQGIVTVCDAATGRPLCFLDGPELTGRRTAAVSLLGVRTFLPGAPQGILLIGTGRQAAYHLAAIAALHPRCQVWVRGSGRASEQAFCQAHAALHAHLQPCPAALPEAVDVVIALTTSKQVVYDEAPRRGRLVIGVGAFKPEMAEVGPVTLAGSALYADDPAGARHEAGDLLRAGIDWQRVRPLAAALHGERPAGPVVLKSVGTAAWDLAAARVALRALA